MGIRRRLAGGVAAASASVLPFALDVPGAAASEHYDEFRGFDHSFRTGTGTTVTCHIDGGSSLFRETGDPTFDASSVTSVFGPAGCEAFVTVETRYRNPTGLARESSTSGENFVSLFNDDVASEFVATHTLFFTSCQDNCFVSFQTTPK